MVFIDPRKSKSNTKTSARPTELEISARLVQVWDLDIARECFKCHMLVNMKWSCPDKLKEQAKEHGEDEMDIGWQPEWVPLIRIDRQICELSRRETQYRAVCTSVDGSDDWIIEGYQRLTVEVSEIFDLKGFPYDFQDLNIRVDVLNVESLRPLEHGEDDAAVALEEVGMDLPDYNLNEGSPAVYRFEDRKAHTPAYIHICCIYEHIDQFHRVNSIGLVFLIVACSFAIWMTQWQDELGERLNNDLVLLLIVIAFKQTLSTTLPKIAYFTLLDWYVLVAIAFLVLTLVSHGVLEYFYCACADVEKAKPDTTTCRGFFAWINSVLGVVHLLGWLLWNGIFYHISRRHMQFNMAITSAESFANLGFKPATIYDTDLTIGFRSMRPRRLRAKASRPSWTSASPTILTMSAPDIFRQTGWRKSGWGQLKA